MKIILSILAIALLTSAVMWFYPGVAAVALTDEEINACATIVALMNPLSAHTESDPEGPTT